MGRENIAEGLGKKCILVLCRKRKRLGVAGA